MKLLPDQRFAQKNNPLLLVAIVLSFVALVISCSTLIFVYAISSGSDLNKTELPKAPANVSEDEGIHGLRFISREAWLAQPAGNVSDLSLPVSTVIIAHTATENCTNQATCTFRVRYIQEFHMESQGWDDIGYNFLVGGDGRIYIGRGWDKQGAHTKGFNQMSICIAFIGTFSKQTPPQQQIEAAQGLIQLGVITKKLRPDYRLYGHRQLARNESPGLALYEIIKTWPHWSENFINDK